jgi:hypothetical protein
LFYKCEDIYHPEHIMYLHFAVFCRSFYYLYFLWSKFLCVLCNRELLHAGSCPQVFVILYWTPSVCENIFLCAFMCFCLISFVFFFQQRYVFVSFIIFPFTYFWVICRKGRFQNLLYSLILSDRFLFIFQGVLAIPPSSTPISQPLKSHCNQYYP